MKHFRLTYGLSPMTHILYRYVHKLTRSILFPRKTCHSEPFACHSEAKPKNLVFSCLLSTTYCLLFIPLLFCSNAQAVVTPQIAAGVEHTIALKSDGTLEKSQGVRSIFLACHFSRRILLIEVKCISR